CREWTGVGAMGEARCVRAGDRPSQSLVCLVSNHEDRAGCQTDHLPSDTAQEYAMQPSPLVYPHDNEIGAALLGDENNRLRRGPESDFHVPDAMEGAWHEVAELGQGLLIVVIENHRRLGWCGDAQVPAQNGIKTRLGTWESWHEVDVCARIPWQYVEECDLGVMARCFRKCVAQGMLRCLRKIRWGQYMGEGHGNPP